ncbi:MAG: hypothetical protein SWY16_14390 [Cyanobacteriota bacterium]|nr:hypothetical protein [Cyanobacteriota bacterium]
MASLTVEEFNYEDTSGREYETLNSGYLYIDDPAEEAISMPFVVWRPIFAYLRPVNWWEDLNLSVEGDETYTGLDSLRYVNFKVDDNPNEFYYLMVPQLDDNDPFAQLDGISIDVEEPVEELTNGTIEQILASNYTLDRIVEDDSVEITTLLERPDISNPNPTPVPEPSPSGGISLLSLLFLGVWLKRRLLKHRKPVRI